MAAANHEFATGMLPVSASSTANRKLLRFTTAGSVDDGKSTLIGRLLYDSQAIFEDQLSSVRNSRINRSTGPIDFSLLTDGLRAEREQGITIDVAYRYFSTPRRKFIIADTPGHEQYTRNMVTGASTADAAVVLIDATKGVLPQSRRHSYISSLLGIRAVIAAVNKMDLVGYSADVFSRIGDDFRALSDKLGIPQVYVLPISALEGDNVVRRGVRMPWFTGPTLLHYLEELDVSEGEQSSAFRFPVQHVIRPDGTFRGFAGQVECGTVSIGDTITVLPSRIKATVKSLESFDGARQQASTGEPITVTLSEEVDISRGDLLVSEGQPPTVAQRFQADMVWLSGDPLASDKLYLLKHTTRSVRARVSSIRHRVDINSLSNVPAQTLHLNDVGLVEISTTLPIFFDPYERNRAMGSFILIDPLSNATVAAGMISTALGGSAQGIVTDKGRVTAGDRRTRNGHHPALVYLQGTSKAAALLERSLFDEGWHTYLVKGSDYTDEQLTTLLTLLHTTGAVAVLFDSAALNPLVRNLFRTDYFHFEANGLSDLELVGDVLQALWQWRAASAETEQA